MICCSLGSLTGSLTKQLLAVANHYTALLHNSTHSSLCLLYLFADLRFTFRARKEEDDAAPVVQFQDVEGELTLDIYGSTQQDVNRCKQMLDKQFEKALKKVDWKEKQTYDADRVNIAKLTPNQVFDLSKNSD